MFFNSRRVQRNIQIQHILRRYFSHDNNSNDKSKIRNIGILAHIDAGKYCFV